MINSCSWIYIWMPCPRLRDKPKSLYLHYHSVYVVDSILTLLERVLSIKSHDHVITWFCENTWQTKIIIYPLPQCLWPTKLIGWGYTKGSFLSLTHTLWSLGFTRSREILGLLSPHYNKTYGNQNWQGSDLLWEASTPKVTQPSEFSFI